MVTPFLASIAEHLTYAQPSHHNTRNVFHKCIQSSKMHHIQPLIGNVGYTDSWAGYVCFIRNNPYFTAVNYVCNFRHPSCDIINLVTTKWILQYIKERLMFWNDFTVDVVAHGVHRPVYNFVLYFLASVRLILQEEMAWRCSSNKVTWERSVS